MTQRPTTRGSPQQHNRENPLTVPSWAWPSTARGDRAFLVLLSLCTELRNTDSYQIPLGCEQGHRGSQVDLAPVLAGEGCGHMATLASCLRGREFPACLYCSPAVPPQVLKKPLPTLSITYGQNSAKQEQRYRLQPSERSHTRPQPAPFHRDPRDSFTPSCE